MGRYAERTDVKVSKSREELERTATRYGATRFATMSEDGRAMVMFESAGRRVMFELPLPKREEFATRKKYGRAVVADPAWTAEQLEQACRQRWRALNLVVKAKLEAVSAGIATFEDEFLAYIVLPNGGTVGRWMKPQLAKAYESKKMPPMLTDGRER